MFTAYGVPEHIVTDNGPQFISQQFTDFVRAQGIQHSQSALYHPATNGLAERFVQTLKQAMKASFSSGLPLAHHLCDFLLTYHSTVHATTGVTPSLLFLQRKLCTHFDLLRPDPGAQVSVKQSRQKQDHDWHAKQRTFAVGDLVFARNFRAGPNWVPATVVARQGLLSYLLEILEGEIWRPHIEHVKSRAHSSFLFPSQIQPGTTDESWGSVDIAPDQSQPRVPTQESAPRCPEPQEQPELPGTLVINSEGFQTVSNRYPARDRQAPNYYRPIV